MDTQNKMQCYEAADILCLRGEEGELGSGSYGVVLLARHKALGFVAVKCFPVTGGSGEKKMLIKRIQDEIGLLQISSHKNITRVHGWTKWPFAMGIVMQYYQGGNLRNLLLNGDIEISLRLKMRMCAEIGEGLAYIHNFVTGKRMTHGDMKPENILLDEDLHCMIADFGGAKISSATGFSTTSTNSNPKTLQFTLVYAAPERLANKFARLNWKEDVYSFGLIVFYVFAREQPYEHFHGSDEDFRKAIVEGFRPDTEAIDEYAETLTKKDAKILKDATAIMKRCWVQNPSHRPPMSSVRDEFLSLLVTDYDYEKDVSTMQQRLGIKEVLTNAKLTPIHCFNPATGKFDEGGEQLNLPKRPEGSKPTLDASYHSYSFADDSSDDSVFSDEPVPSLPASTGTLETIAILPSYSTDASYHSCSISHESSNDSVFSDEPGPSLPAKTGTLETFTAISTLNTTSFTDLMEEIYRTINTVELGDSYDMSEELSEEISSTVIELKRVMALIKTYASYFDEGCFEKCRMVTEELVHLILSEVDASAEQIRKFATQMRKESKFVVAILFYSVAVEMFLAQCPPSEASNGLVITAGGLKKSGLEMANAFSCNLSPVKFVTRVLDGIMNKVEGIDLNNPITGVLNKCRCMYYIACLSRLTADYKKSEELLSLVLKLLEEKFGQQSIKQPLHALCLTQLGFVYSSTSRYSEARESLSRAIVSHREVRYADNETRVKNLTMCTSELERIAKL